MAGNFQRKCADADESASPDVQAVTAFYIDSLASDLQTKSTENDSTIWKAHFNFLADVIEDFETGRKSFEFPEAPYFPPGAPVGSGNLMIPVSCSY